MKHGMVAFHYPTPDHRDEFVARVRAVAEVFRSTPGCLSADCWLAPDSGAVVSAVQWESEAASQAGFAAVSAADVDVAFDDREVRPREIHRLMSA
ncbi:antibiotic biosynthesis monooxygenase [Saccharothrix variisporea]|uniref:Quinol monooxygenase YgiN n=1 Tax=Saccharothrix variisporea TaxID=543527 RepID=A0A495X7C1_9PSEU|nr:antibiotic biosynthesis monooxygenase [Saccharothrix variisporea]RKT69055.1 quinol monooxygenase YgiN [Saccharothrix variisporea]